MTSTATSDTTTLPSIKVLAEVRIVSLRGVMANYRAQKTLWSQVTAFCAEHAIEIAGACFTIYYDTGYKEKDVDMEVCLPIASDVAVPESIELGDIQLRTLPAVPKAASITYIGNYDGLPEVYNMLYGWISTNGYEPNAPVREVYLKMDPEDASEASFVTELQQSLA